MTNLFAIDRIVMTTATQVSYYLLAIPKGLSDDTFGLIFVFYQMYADLASLIGEGSMKTFGCAWSIGPWNLRVADQHDKFLRDHDGGILSFEERENHCPYVNLYFQQVVSFAVSEY